MGPHCGSFQWRNSPLAEHSNDGAFQRDLSAEPSRGTLQWRGIPITDPAWDTFLRDHSWGCFQWLNLQMVVPSNDGTSLRSLPAEPARDTFQLRNFPLPPHKPPPTNRGATCVLRARAPHTDFKIHMWLLFSCTNPPSQTQTRCTGSGLAPASLPPNLRGLLSLDPAK